MQAEIIYPGRDIVGESIVWDEQRGALHWVDIVGKKIQSLEIETGEYSAWSTPGIVTSLGLRKDGGAIVGLKNSVSLWDFGGPFTPFVDVEPDFPDNRLNEGVVGPDGAFWIGTMQDNISANGAPKEITDDRGHIFRITADGKITQVCKDSFGITNTFVWSSDGRFITADTPKNKIYSYEIDPATAQLSNRRTILSDFERGLPDGSCLDAEGFVWNCRVVGGACLVRISPNGEVDRVVDLPCSWPTSCAFGGKDLDRLFVTSARFTMDEAHLRNAPQEGALFSIDVGVRGLNPNRFG